MAQNNRRGRSGRRRGGNQGNNPNRSIDSQGPEVKIRGNAQQVYDKYTALARDAFSSGDRIRAESLQQHAEHYYRVLQAMKPPEQKDGQKDPSKDEQSGGQNAQANGHDRSGEDANQDGEQEGGRRPRRERRSRRDDAEVTEQPEAAKADEPSGRAAVETAGEDGPDARKGDARADGEAPDDEPKPRRRRTRRRKADDDAEASGGSESEAEAPAA